MSHDGAYLIVAANIDPEADARSLSSNAISAMARSVFGDIAGPVISNDLLDMLGLGKTSHVEEYLKQIQAKLDEMQTQIAQLQVSIGEILNGIAIIQEQIPGIEVQQILQSFSQQATLIKQNFQSYADAVASLTSKNPGVIDQVVTDLFQLLGLINMQQVATAMTTIQQLFLPALAEQRGLIDLQHDVVRAAIVGFAANPENFRIATKPPHQLTDGRWIADRRAIPCANGVFASSEIVLQGHAKANSVLRASVSDAFKAFMTVQTQGLTLLRVAWLGSIHEDQVKRQSIAIQAVLDAIKGFEATVVAAVDAQVADSLKTSGQRLSGTAATNDIRYDYGFGDVRMEYPLSTDWLMWTSTQDGGDGIIVAQTPWTYKSSTSAKLWYDTSQDAPHIFIYRSDEQRTPPQYRTPMVKASRYAGIPVELAFIRTL